MSDNIDELIRAAQTRLAEGPVDPGRVRSTLPALRGRRARRHRYTVLGAAAVALAVAVVIGVPVVVLQHPASGPAVGGSPPSTSRIPLQYRPTAIPSGLGQHEITVSLSGSMAVPEHPTTIERAWNSDRSGTDPGPPSDVRLTVLASTDAAYPASGYPNAGQGVAVEVNGHAGRYTSGSGTGPVVAWRVDAETVLTLLGQPGQSKEAVLAMARATEPDSTEVRFPLRPGWLPAGVSPTYAKLSGTSRTDWSADLSAQGADVPLTPPVEGSVSAVSTFVSATLGTADQHMFVPPGGAPVTVHGQPARLVTSEDDSDPRMTLVQNWLIMNVSPGVTLTIHTSAPKSHPISTADVLTVAENLGVDTDPDLTWIGTR